MRGTDATNGRALSGIEHLRQSIADILQTRKGTRVMRRDYGSDLFELIDAPLNRQTVVKVIAATADAITTWEKRISLSRVVVTESTPGRIELDIIGTYLPDGTPIKLQGVTVQNLAPWITSPTVVDAPYAQPFSYQITAGGNANRYYVVGGLPVGLSLNPTTGLISGMLEKFESISIRIGAVNSAGYDERNVLINVPVPAPINNPSAVRIRISNAPFTGWINGLYRQANPNGEWILPWQSANQWFYLETNLRESMDPATYVAFPVLTLYSYNNKGLSFSMGSAAGESCWFLVDAAYQAQSVVEVGRYYGKIIGVAGSQPASGPAVQSGNSGYGTVEILQWYP